ncbi:hypothetical protein K3G39_07555 [Pontibacter sp. HSC-14F20]|uniref:hypothetical protein n=1 Tax=Pontibacter sp. HSC-14F20 TaxID=2864136 RepID=UPI001C73A8EE|nr:hypothetical protein [Pontibacter sp. HSC-14F20]MBX0333089.1 hypothetical protein [Pontibacter sp. HSC-14F20]
MYNNSESDAVRLVRLKIEDVRDSRCPSDVVCVAYGRVEVTLRLETGEGIGDTTTICLGGCAGGSQSDDVAQVMVGAIPYKIRLLDVTPLPSHKDKTSKTKEVRLVLERN